MLTAGVLIVLGVLVCAVQHVYWTRRLVERNAQWRARFDEATGRLADDCAAWREVADRNEETAASAIKSAGRYKEAWREARYDADDARNLLVAEQARTSILEDELSRIAVQGKSLWPTLAEDDVVVRLRSVDGGAR